MRGDREDKNGNDSNLPQNQIGNNMNPKKQVNAG